MTGDVGPPGPPGPITTVIQPDGTNVTVVKVSPARVRSVHQVTGSYSVSAPVMKGGPARYARRKR